MTDDSRPVRLPPPAFPSASRSSERVDTLESALIPPEPERSEGGPDRGVELPFLASDDPFFLESEEGVATGIGDNPHLDPTALRAGGDPALRDLTEVVAKLAEALRRRGEAGLHASTDMSRFEATLRAYCVGYLAGRRAEIGGYDRS